MHEKCKMTRAKPEHKVISKKIKYGHLQKLKWYCELCQHQCNDEYSFRQHVESEKHRMMMTHFRANPKSIINSNSHTFECTFMDILRRRYPNREINANIVYTQLISDKNHVHMNSTRWESVRGFCTHLEQIGKIKMRWTERGAMITYIDKTAEQSRIQQEQRKALESKQEHELVQKMLEQQPQAKPEPTKVVEVKPVDAVIQTEVQVQEKKANPLFSRVSRPKPPPKSVAT